MNQFHIAASVIGSEAVVQLCVACKAWHTEGMMFSIQIYVQVKKRLPPTC